MVVTMTSSIRRCRRERGMIRWDLVMGLGGVLEEEWEDRALVADLVEVVVGLEDRRIHLGVSVGVISSDGTVAMAGFLGGRRRKNQCDGG